MKKVNLFIIGAAKAGTTTIYKYLKSHPEIYGCPIKEPNFFGSDIQWSQFRHEYQKKTYLDVEKYLSGKQLKPRHNAFINSLAHYEELFREAEYEKYLLDTSTSYLYSENAAEEIFEYNPEAKIIIILRDPVDRTISHYKMDYVNGTQPEKDIVKGIEKDYYAGKKGYGISHLYIELSQYFSQIQRYASVFNRNQILILKFNDLRENPSQLGKNICQFLHVSGYSSDLINNAQNKTSMLRFPVLDKLQWAKNIFPQSLTNYFKSKSSFLYQDEIPLVIGGEERDFIKNMIKEDWERTIDFLKINSYSSFST